MDSRKTKLKELLRKEKMGANTQAQITSFSSPPSSPMIVDSISPIRSPLRAHRRMNHISTPETPPARKADSVPIDAIDSPTASELQSEAKPMPKRRLGEELKRVLASYKTSVRNWEHTIGKTNPYCDDRPILGDGHGLDLIIQKCISFNIKGGGPGGCKDLPPTLALCYELAAKDGIPGLTNPDKFELIQPPKWVYFKSRVPGEIVEGTVAKLYAPWEQIFAPSVGEEVIFCTDLFKVFSPNEIPSNLATLVLPVDPVAENMVRRLFAESHELAWDVCRPYSFRNNNTITKQVVRNQPVDLDAVICETWLKPSENLVSFLVKDSDNFLTFIEEVPEGHTNVDSLKPGAFCNLRNLKVQDKITTDRWLPLFSVIDLFNSSQAHIDKFYYKLRFNVCTTIKRVPHLGIPFSGSRIKKVTVVELLQFPQSMDQRCIIEGTLAKKSSSDALLRDESGMVEVRVLTSFGWERTILGERVTLTYLRRFRGICTLDQFSIIEKVSDS